MPDPLVLVSPDALAALLRAQVEPLERRIDALTARLDQQAATHLVADKAYSVAEAAEWLGLRPHTVYKIPRSLLPRVRGGRITGAALVEYRDGVKMRRAA